MLQLQTSTHKTKILYLSSLPIYIIALLLSALKSNGIPYTPALIKKIIENTAAPLGSHDQFSVGHGVLQV